MNLNQGQVYPDFPSLKVLTGTTVDLSGDGLYQYLDVEVEAGGTLIITGEAGGWTEILCARAMILNGTLLCRAGYDGGSTHGTGTFTKESELGLGTLSYSITQTSGARGGNDSANIGSGGNQNGGVGGGGAGANIVFGSGRTNGGSGNGSGRGNGGNGSGRNGGSGASNGGSGASNGGSYGGGGGGGGYKGHHGKGLVVYAQNIQGIGNIDCSGRNGFNGGNGASGNGGGNGGRGGGGAGGSGGHLIVRYKQLAPTVNLLINGGVGGANGSGGSGGAGTAQSGQDGTLDVATY